MALGIRQKLLSAAATDETKATTPAVFKYVGCRRVVHTVEWGTSVSAGEVCIEAASDPDYAGTWAILGTITYAAGAPHVVTFVSDGPYAALRHRINTAVAGGTVTTYLTGETE